MEGLFYQKEVRMQEQLTFKNLSKAEKDYICNGCGPKKILAKFGFKRLPKWLSVAQFEGCEEHDFDYEVGGTEEDRVIADLKLKRAMEIEANKAFFLLAFFRLFIAGHFFKLIQKHGHDHFKYSDHKLTRSELWLRMEYHESD